MVDQIPAEAVGEVTVNKGDIRFKITDPEMVKALEAGNLSFSDLSFYRTGPVVWTLDTYIQSFLLDSRDKFEEKLKKEIESLFGSVEAFEKVADQYILEYKDDTPLFDYTIGFFAEDEIRFRLNTVWRIRKKTEEELAEDKKEDGVSTPDL